MKRLIRDVFIRPQIKKRADNESRPRLCPRPCVTWQIFSGLSERLRHSSCEVRLQIYRLYKLNVSDRFPHLPSVCRGMLNYWQLETIVLTKRETGTQRTENSTSSLCQLKFSGSAILMPDCRPVWSHVCADSLEEVLLTPRSVRLQPRFLSLLNFLKQFNRLAQLSAMRSHQSLLTGVEDRVLEWCDLNKWRLQLRNKTFGKKICGCEAKPDVCSCLKLGDKLIANTAWIKHGWKWKVVPV